MVLSGKSFFYLLTLFAVGFTNVLHSQTVQLKDKISFVINNASVTDALDALSNQTGNTFSYNPDHIPTSRIVKVDIHNQPLISVITAILGSPTYGFKQIGNQIVLFRSSDISIPKLEDKSELTKKEITETPKQNSIKVNGKTSEVNPDTIFIYRDIHDTIKIVEYLTKTDTIIEKVATPVSGNEIFKNTVDLSKELTKKVKFDIGVFAGAFFPGAEYSASDLYAEKLKQYNSSFSGKSLSGSAGIEFQASYAKWISTIGLAYTSFNQKLNYTYLVESGGYYKIDTLDAYYQIIEGQEEWTYLTDSSYLPIDNSLYDYKINNHTRYLEVPISVGFNFPAGNTLIFVKGGVITGFFLNSDGHQIKLSENGVISTDEIMPEKVVFSYKASIGMSIPLSRKLVLAPELFYRNHFSSIYKNYPINTKFSAFGFYTSLWYKL